MEHWYLLYVLMTFSIGMATLGTIALAVRKTQERSLTYYLFLHIVSTLAVFSQMFFLYLQTSLSGVSPETIGFMEYVEDFAIKYALTIALLLFLHEFFAVSHAKTRNLMMDCQRNELNAFNASGVCGNARLSANIAVSRELSMHRHVIADCVLLE